MHFAFYISSPVLMIWRALSYCRIQKRESAMKRRKFAKSRKEFLQKPIGELIDLLSNEDLEVRFFAEMSLRDLSGT